MNSDKIIKLYNEYQGKITILLEDIKHVAPEERTSFYKKYLTGEEEKISNSFLQELTGLIVEDLKTSSPRIHPKSMEDKRIVLHSLHSHDLEEYNARKNSGSFRNISSFSREDPKRHIRLTKSALSPLLKIFICVVGESEEIKEGRVLVEEMQEDRAITKIQLDQIVELPSF